MKCKHGLTWETCGHCQREKKLTIPFTPHLFRHRSGQMLGLTAGEPDSDGLVKVFAVRNTERKIGLEKTKTTDIVIDSKRTLVPRDTLRNLRKLAMSRAHIFEPDHPLTKRESSDRGPSRCWDCREPLSFQLGSLACCCCKYYVCKQGHCVCDFPGGKNYLDQFMSPGPGLPCEIELRFVCATIVRAITPQGAWASWIS